MPPACSPASRLKIWPARANRTPAGLPLGRSPDLRRSYDGAPTRLLLSTLTDEFASRRISRIDVRVLPIQIEHHWQDIAATTPPLPCADYLAVTKAQD